jgi:hypothetical protein
MTNEDIAVAKDERSAGFTESTASWVGSNEACDFVFFTGIIRTEAVSNVTYKTADN